MKKEEEFWICKASFETANRIKGNSLQNVAHKCDDFYEKGKWTGTEIELIIDY